MSLLIVNTLPAEDKTVSDRIARLTDGISDYNVVHTAELTIKPCVGCNACWLITPGICSIKDDYDKLLHAYLQYDTIIFLAGTALGFVNHQMKNLIDRILPLVTMYVKIQDGEIRHTLRYDKEYRFGLLYEGEADREYLTEWMDRVALNFGGKIIGVYPLEMCEEIKPCIL